MAARRLTDRQTAVLAALERRGPATLLDLREDFPHLAASALARVLAALVAAGRVGACGDPSLAYLGGVTYSARPLTGPGEDDVQLAALLSRIEASERWSAWVDVDRAAVVVALPFTAVLDALQSAPDGDFEALRELLGLLARDGVAAWTVIDSDVTVDGCEPALRIVVGIRGEAIDRGADDEPAATA